MLKLALTTASTLVMMTGEAEAAARTTARAASLTSTQATFMGNMFNNGDSIILHGEIMNNPLTH